MFLLLLSDLLVKICLNYFTTLAWLGDCGGRGRGCLIPHPRHHRPGRVERWEDCQYCQSSEDGHSGISAPVKLN